MSSSTKPEDDEKTITRTKSSDVEGGVLAETRDVYNEEDSGVDPVYQAKARILNDAVQEIGMGKYQVSQNPWSRGYKYIASLVVASTD